MIHTKEQLKRYRLSKNWSYREMERQTGLNRKSLSKWEKNGIPENKKTYLNYVLFYGKRKNRFNRLKGCARILLFIFSFGTPRQR